MSRTEPPADARVIRESSRIAAAALVGEMTLPEKAAQLAQVDKGAVDPQTVAEHGIGSVLSGGGGNPDPNTPEAWAEMVGSFVEASTGSRLGIPALYGTDAVHGHSNVVGATIFPHNIGLGAAGDPALVERVYRATALETAATGVRWDFAPTVAVSIDPRWGRCYEAFGDDPAAVGRLGVAAVRGLQGDRFDAPGSVAACLKHYVGDGATEWGTASKVAWTDWWNGWGTQWHIDQGDVRLDEAALRSIHLAPYVDGVKAGALTVMASYNSWNGEKLHGHHGLLTGVLKGELGFEGFVVSDWMGLDQLDPDPYRCAVMGIGAGVDMVMIPFEFERFHRDVIRAVETGDITTERIDDAVTRIVAVKHAMGLLDPEPPMSPSLAVVGSADHRAIGREAAAASAVLLDHAGGLPLTGGRILVAGPGAHDVGLQCGGWTISWQGESGPTTPGTTILEGLRAALPEADIVHAPDGRFDVDAPVGVAVVAEPPYAEGLGDRGDLRLSDEQVGIVERLRDRVERLVLVVLSGRPLVLGALRERCDAIVAAWLPGTEGGGVADVLTGAAPFAGRLPRRWPASEDQVEDPGAAWPAAWDRGHGLEL